DGAAPDRGPEAPVERGGLQREVAVRGELPLERAEENDRVEDHAAGHVRAVEAGEREEDAREDPVAREEAEPRVLVALTDEEEHAEDQCRDEPVAESLAVAPLDRVHR